MNIFIDESGIFANPLKKVHSVSVVGMLVIPESEQGTIESEFMQFRDRSSAKNKELKGSKVTEIQAAELIEILSAKDCLYFASATDLGFSSEETITIHKNDQASRFTNNIEEMKHESMRQSLRELKKRLQEIPNQLYVQAALMNSLIFKLIHDATLYYSQRKPNCLGLFNWSIDAKGDGITEYESLWKDIVMPYVQTKSLSDPFPQFTEGDFSSMERFFIELDAPPKHLAAPLGRSKGKFYGLDARLLLSENLQFLDSQESVGLQIVDILTSVLRRAFMGNIQFSGWKNIGKLMLQSKKNQVIDLVAFGNMDSKKTVPYARVVSRTTQLCKQMLLPRYFD